MDPVEESLAGERALLDPAVRSSTSAIDRLLHPDFAERGKSGRRWTREETLLALPSEAVSREAVSHVSPELRDLRGDEISDGVVLVEYVSVRGSERVGRSSLWIRDDGRMRIRWHQGTPTSDINPSDINP